MPKFRRLTIDELEELKDEFINFLTVSGIYADDWQKILKEQPDSADTFIDNFSDLVFEKSLKKIKYLENKSDKDLKLFKCLDDKIHFKGQDHNEASYAAKIEKNEGKIRWNESAENIIGKINGLYPSPGAFFIHKGERYKILKAISVLGSGEIGEVLDNYLEISCGNKKSIKVIEIQRQGKRPQNISEFMLGSQIKKGSNLNNA